MTLFSSTIEVSNSTDIEGPDSVQRYKLGTKLIVHSELEDSLYTQEWFYCYAPYDVGDQRITDDGMGLPHMIGSRYHLVDWTQSFNPDMAQVVASQWNIAQGQYSFVLFKGEGNMQMERLDLFKPAGTYLKAEGDLEVFGQTGTRTAYTCGFTTEDREIGQKYVKGCLFGIQTNVSTASEE